MHELGNHVANEWHTSELVGVQMGRPSRDGPPARNGMGPIKSGTARSTN